MFEKIIEEIWGHFKGEWGIISLAPVAFLGAVSFGSVLIGYVTYRYVEARSKDQIETLKATIIYQTEQLEGYRAKTVVNDDMQTSASAQMPDFKLILTGGSVFVPDADDIKGLWTGLGITAKVWNVGAKCVVTNWSLTVVPKGKTAVLAQLTNTPEKLIASGAVNSSILHSGDSLVDKTSIQRVTQIPIEGTLLFYVGISKDIVVDQDTWLELSVTDIFGKETIARQRMGDWLQR